MAPTLRIFFVTILGLGCALAQSAGGPYTISTASLDPAGGRTISGTCRNDGALGATGAQLTSSASYQAASGYPSTLRDATALAVLPGILAETASVSLTLRQVLDDGTQTAVSSVGAVWNVLSGPLSINASGTATAQSVFADTAASLQVTLGTLTSPVSLMVKDTVPDNFGTYGSDGVGDDWQVQFFGQNNPQAAPGLDPDGDGQSNLFEFTVGLSPISGNSRFTCSLQDVPGQPGKKRMVFEPANAGRIFTLYRNTTLAPGGWEVVPGAVTSGSDGRSSTLTDPSPPSDRTFYRVQINLE